MVARSSPPTRSDLVTTRRHQPTGRPERLRVRRRTWAFPGRTAERSGGPPGISPGHKGPGRPGVLQARQPSMGEPSIPPSLSPSRLVVQDPRLHSSEPITCPDLPDEDLREAERVASIPIRIEVIRHDDRIIELGIDPVEDRGRLDPPEVDELAEQPGVAGDGAVALVEVDQTHVGQQVPPRIRGQGHGVAERTEPD